MPNQHDYAVVNNGELSGLVSLSMLRYLPKETWSSTTLEKVVRRGATPKAWPDEPVEDVLQRMTEHSLTILPVVERESEEFLGTVTSQDILDLITLEAKGEH
jgi:CBS domain-containing protein